MGQATRGKRRTVRTTASGATDRSTALMSKAAALMAQQGYHNTSMRDVARAAQSSLAGLYHYFASKEDLLFQIQHRVFLSLLEVQEQSMRANVPLEEKLRTLVGNHLDFFVRHAAELKVCTLELDSLNGALYRQVEHLRRRYYQLVAQLVRGLLESSGKAPSNTEVRRLTLYVFGMLNWIFMWLDVNRDGPVEQLTNEIVGLVLTGLCGVSPAAGRVAAS